MNFVGKQNIRSLHEFPIITDFCHKYCTINQIFLKFTYFWRMNASWQNSCIDFFRSDSNEIITMEFNVMFLMLLPYYELDSFGLHACYAIKIINWNSTILRRLRAMFMLHRITFAPAHKPYRIGLLFTHKNTSTVVLASDWAEKHKSFLAPITSQDGGNRLELVW